MRASSPSRSHHASQSGPTPSPASDWVVSPDHATRVSSSSRTARTASSTSSAATAASNSVSSLRISACRAVGARHRPDEPEEAGATPWPSFSQRPGRPARRWGGSTPLRDYFRLAGPPHGHDAVADHGRRASVEIEHAPRVLVDAEYPPGVRQLRLEDGQPPLAQIAEAGVVVAPLGVVVVGDDRHVGPEGAEQVEPVGPDRVGTHLVDLVHRHRVAAQREGGGAGEHHAPPVGQLVGEQIGHVGPGPLAQGVGGAAGPGEHPAGRP